MYLQYDTMACPKSFSTINKKERFTKWLKERAEKKQEQIIIPEPSLMSQMCLEIHLIPTRSLFMEGNFYDTFDVSPATDRFVRLFESIYEPIIPVTWYGHRTTEKKKIESVKKVEH